MLRPPTRGLTKHLSLTRIIQLQNRLTTLGEAPRILVSAKYGTRGAPIEMPIYEYHCPPCDHSFETLIRNTSDVARCPRCGSIDLAKQFSVPAVAHSTRASGLPICNDMGASRGACSRPECGSGQCAFD